MQRFSELNEREHRSLYLFETPETPANVGEGNRNPETDENVPEWAKARILRADTDIKLSEVEYRNMEDSNVVRSDPEHSLDPAEKMANACALGEMLIDQNPESMEEHVGNMESMLAELKHGAESLRPQSADATSMHEMIGALEQAIFLQKSVDRTLNGENGKRYGNVYAMPGIGIIGTDLYAEIYVQPTDSLESFQAQTMQFNEHPPAAFVAKETEMRTAMLDELSDVKTRLETMITRKKNEILELIEIEKSAGAFRHFHDWFRVMPWGTKTDLYGISKSNVKREIAVLQDVVRPNAERASAYLSQSSPLLYAAKEQIDSIKRNLLTGNKVNIDQTLTNLEQKSINASGQAAELLLTSASLGTAAGGKAAFEAGKGGLKIAYNVVKSQATKEIVKRGGQIALGAAIGSELLYDEHSMASGGGLEHVMEDLSSEQVIAATEAQLLKAVPQGEYVYSDSLMQKLENHTNEVIQKFSDIRATKNPEEKRREEKELVMLIERSTGEVRAQFIRDNVDPSDDDTKKRFEVAEQNRKNGVPGLEGLAAEMRIISCLSADSPAKAMEAAKTYVRNTLLGLDNGDVPTAKNLKFIDEMAADMMHEVQTVVYPLFIKIVKSYADQGIEKTFRTRVHGARKFAEKFLTNPAKESEDIYQNVKSTVNVLIDNTGEMGDVATIAADAARSLYNVSLSDVDLRSLLSTLTGELSFAMVTSGMASSLGNTAKSLKLGGIISATTAKGVQTTNIGFRTLNSLKAFRGRK